jgi:type IV fimbrial biogenesis protein FimT
MNAARARHAVARRLRGLTLIELMVTVSIVAILATMAAPSFRDFILRNRSATLANELTGTILRARNEAINRNTCVVVCRTLNPVHPAPTCSTGSADWRPGWMVFVDATCAGTANQPATADLLVMATGPFDPGFTLVKNGTNTDRLMFNASGNARAGDAGRFDLRWQSTTRTSNRGICLNALGRTRVIEFEGTC